MATARTEVRGRAARPRALSVWLQNLDWKHAIFAAVIAILVYQVAVPLVVLVWGSFTSAQPGDATYFSPETWTLEHYLHAFSSPYLYNALGNTAVFATGTTVLSFVLGGALAWLVVRTNTPFAWLITILAYVRLIIPGILTTVAWIFLGSPEIGMINTFFKNLLGIDWAIINIYSMGGMIWVEAMDVLPLAFILMSAALRSMDPSFEEASLTSGKGLFQTTVRITLPLVLPAILATLMLLFIRGIETFEVPFLLGIPAGIFTFVTEIYINTTKRPTDHGLAGAYAVLVLLFSMGLVWAYGQATKRSEAFATISGKAFRPRVTDLGPWRWLGFAFAMAIMMFSVGLPLLVMVWSSFMPRFEPIRLEALSMVTLENYRYVIDYPATRRAFLNSSFLGITSATAVVFLISIVAWLVVKTRLPGRQLLDGLAFAPIAVPSVMMGVAFLWFYLTVPLPVYGTIWILFLLYVTRYMPLVMRILSSSMMQINNELHEAAEVSGSSWWRSFRTVTLPLLRPGMVVGWIFVLVHAFREVSGSLMVYSSGNEPIGIAILDLWADGSYAYLSAFGVLVFVVLVVLSVLAQWIGSKFGVRGT